jgi:uncharacterized protein
VFGNTLALVKRIGGRTPVIIPHLGMLNGGYGRLKASGIWDNKTVYADTALAQMRHIMDKLIFGSDFPFGEPTEEKSKILSLQLSDDEKKLILTGNIDKLLGEVITPNR